MKKATSGLAFQLSGCGESVFHPRNVILMERNRCIYSKCRNLGTFLGYLTQGHMQRLNCPLDCKRYGTLTLKIYQYTWIKPDIKYGKG